MDRRGFLGKVLGLGAVLVGVKALTPEQSYAAEFSRRIDVGLIGRPLAYNGVTLKPKTLTCLIKVPRELIPTPRFIIFRDGPFVGEVT